MTVTVDNSSDHGVALTDSTANAAIHGPHDRSSNHGVSTTDAETAAVLNTATALE